MNTTAQCNSTAGTTYKVGALDHDGTGAGQRFAYAIVSTCPNEPTLGIVWTAAEIFMTAATDPANPSGTAFTPTASFGGSASTNGMNNAATTMLTIGVPAGTPSQSLGAVRLHSSRNNGDWLSEWVVPVQVQ